MFIARLDHPPRQPHPLITCRAEPLLTHQSFSLPSITVEIVSKDDHKASSTDQITFCDQQAFLKYVLRSVTPN